MAPTGVRELLPARACRAAATVSAAERAGTLLLRQLAGGRPRRRRTDHGPGFPRRARWLREGGRGRRGGGPVGAVGQESLERTSTDAAERRRGDHRTCR